MLKNYEEQLILYTYDELSDHERNQLEMHLKECEECRTELSKIESDLLFVSENDDLKINKDQLDKARLELKRRLSNEKVNRSTNLIGFLSRSPLQFAFGSVVLVLIGLLTGYLLFNNSSSFPVNNSNFENANQKSDPVMISDLQFIDSDASDGEIEFMFNAVKPMRLKGSVDDPAIQNILTHSMLKEKNPGVRLNSINAIDSKKNKQFDREIKSALLTVLVSDNNPGVRREAVNLLKEFSYDGEIKRALLYVLENDSSSAMRIEAMNILLDASESGEKFSEEDLNLFKEKLYNDQNNYIRFQARNVIEEYN